MSGYFSRDIYRGIADLSAKRSAKPAAKCVACGNQFQKRGGAQMRCRPCAAEHTVQRMLENNRASHKRRRERQRKQECTL